MRFREIGSAIQAAQDGNGVTLARFLLVADAIRQRGLLPLVPPNQARLCSKRQIARWPGPNDQTAARMATWLVANASVPIAAANE